MTTDPMHLFDLAPKNPAAKTARPILLSPTTQNDVFLNALLETATTRTARRSPLQWAAATGLHIVILATLIIAPLYTTGTIQLAKYEDTPVVAPPAPPPPPRGASWEASQAVCLGDNLEVRSVELSVARGVPYGSHLRSSPHRSELFAWAPTSKHQGRPFQSNPNIRYSRGKRMSRAL